MQSSLINSTTGSMPAKTVMPMLNGRPDYQLSEALTKVSQQAQAKAKARSAIRRAPACGARC
jgi:flagellar protein FlgJ